MYIFMKYAIWSYFFNFKEKRLLVLFFFNLQNYFDKSKSFKFTGVYTDKIHKNKICDFIEIPFLATPTTRLCNFNFQ